MCRAVPRLDSSALTLPLGGHCCSHFSGGEFEALRVELTCPRSLRSLVVGGDVNPGLADPSPCSFPGPVQEGHGDLCIRGAGTPDISGGFVTDPDGAGSQVSLAEQRALPVKQEHFPGTSRRA